MTIDDLQTLIRNEVLADEPPFQMTSPSFVAAGKRAVRRRRLGGAVGVAGIVAVAGIAWVGLQTAGENGTQQGTIPDAAQQVLDEFDPTTFPTIVDSVVREAVGSALPPDVGQIEPTLDGYTRLRPEDYAYTDAWTAWYDLAPGDELMVILHHDQSATEGNAKKYCRENLDAGEMERCSVDRLADGSITITSVSEMNRTRQGFGPPTGNPDSRWFMRQVANRRDYGFGVIAREYVMAQTLAQADAHWSVNPQQLTEIASSPRLVYEMPHGPKKDCNTTFLIPRTEMGYARVVCEKALNH